MIFLGIYCKAADPLADPLADPQFSTENVKLT